MLVKHLAVAVLLISAACVCAAGDYVVPTTTLAKQTSNNTSAANGFVTQTNGNLGGGNVSKVDVHSLLYPGANTKVYAHLLLWFGQPNHMNVGYSSTDAAQIHRQITDMISRGIEGVIVDWYGPNTSIDKATQLVMAEAETHPGFTFAIMVDQGAIQWDSCAGCSPQQALISQLQYIEQTYFPSPAYMTVQGRPVITNFNIDLSYSIDWNAVNAALATQPHFLFQNNNGFTHTLSGGSYSWVMPMTSDYGSSYLSSFYDTGMTFTDEQTVGATYKGFNDSLAAWGSGRVMGQQCGQTWLNTFAEINGLYNSGNQLSNLQLVTWNDYEEGTEIESGISNCLAVSATVASNALTWKANGDASTIDHYVLYISNDGQNLMPLAEPGPGANSANLCSYSIPNGNYILHVQAVGKPSIANTMSGAVNFAATCVAPPPTKFTIAASPSTLAITPGGAATLTVIATPQSGAFNNAIALACDALPATLTCSFAPGSITPGASSASSVLTISSAPATAGNRNCRRNNFLFASLLLVPGIVLAGGTVRRRRICDVLGFCVLTGAILICTSCGGKASPAMAPQTTSQTYPVTVNATSGAVQLSTAVTVTVQ
jgi:hypothetical protein